MKNEFLVLWLGAAILFSGNVAAAAADGPSIKVKVTAELANIRLKPSIGSVIIRQIPQGEILEATKKEGEWFLVRLEPDESGVASGYVHESLVLPLEDVPPAPKKPLIAEKPAEKPRGKPVEKPPVKEPQTKPKPAVPTSVQTEVPAETAAGGSRTFISFYGGAAHALIGDLDEGAQGQADLYSAQLGVPADRDVGSVRSGLLFGGEIGIPLSEGFYLALGAEFISRGRESVLAFARTGSAESDVFTTHPKFTALPIRASVIMYPADFLYVRVGAAYYFASADYYYKFERGTTWQEWTGEAKASGLGILGGIGLDWRLGTIFSFIVEMTGHYAPISGFEGSGTFQDSTLQTPVTEEGTLYAYDAKALGQTAYPQLYIRSQLPSGAGVENAREAKIDFSGLVLRAGIKIRF
jgi:YHS domain-containing protein